MSGSAALSAAKRRRGGSDTANTASQPQNSPGKPSQAALSPIQILNQHHNKLDLLYKRQDRINKVLNISDYDDDDDSETNIVERLDNVERQLNIGIPKSNNNIRDTSSKSNDYEEQIKELKEIIIKAQSHSIQVSLELALLKKKLQVSDDAVSDVVDDAVSDVVDDAVSDVVDDAVSDVVDDAVSDVVDDAVSDKESTDENDYVVG
jgi:hypothetical protein